eukprot:TRINITY_DN48865_c0_g1_i1.p2 TRINITY_DN48865_c0_g1~~TRINITY_DN48865_c0_g1_i1.p2  ORF type:complete len:134 (+),score=17.23 TRINITY_DN48865_c0_g1_i1:56-457(+)
MRTMQVSIEDAAFLEGFHQQVRRIAATSSLVSGSLAYGLARHLGAKRPWTFALYLGTVAPLGSWIYMVKSCPEAERLRDLARRAQQAGGKMEQPSLTRGGGSIASSNAELARLFPMVPPATLPDNGLRSYPQG